MEGFVEYVKLKYNNCPDTITRDNVNMQLYIDHAPKNQSWSFLEEAVYLDNTEIASWLLDIGANISYYELSNAKTHIMLHTLLQAGANPNSVCIDDGDHVINHVKSKTWDWFFGILMDYGSNPSCMKNYHPERHFGYARLVSSRVASSRKALATLIICCKRGFFPLRDVGVALAREMWGARGPAGCGPRAYTWSEEK